MGGAVGEILNDQTFAGVWFEVNRQVTDSLYQDLKGNRFNANEVIVPLGSDTSRVVTESMPHYQCNRLVQVSQHFAQDDAGNFFSFVVDVQHLKQSPAPSPEAASTEVVMVSEYQREYRFPLTTESLDNFHTGSFANQAFLDLRSSGALTSITK
jgi:hypothetical protein